MSFHDASSPIPGDGQQIQIQPDGMVRFGNDNQTNVLFYTRPVHDPELSRQTGRPMTKGVTYVRIQHPGERDTIDTPVAHKPDAPHRWPRQWAQFQQSKEQIPEGTPIEMLFPQYPEIGANLHSCGVHTIEQMASLTEHGAQSIGMGATQWRNEARAFLEKANKGVGIHKMQAELQKRDNEIEVLRNQVSDLVAQIDRLIAAQQGVPGTMIPTNRPTLAQAHAASVARTSDWTVPSATPHVADWTQAGIHQAAQDPQVFPDYGLAPVAPDAWDAQPLSEPPQQPTARRRGRPPKSAPIS